MSLTQCWRYAFYKIKYNNGLYAIAIYVAYINRALITCLETGATTTFSQARGLEAAGVYPSLIFYCTFITFFNCVSFFIGYNRYCVIVLLYRLLCGEKTTALTSTVIARTGDVHWIDF